MKHPSAFDTLCALYGIESGYADIWGKYHEASRKTRTSLLRAMGVDVHSDTEIELVLDAHQRAQWQRILPAVQVVTVPDRPIQIPLHLPETIADKTLQWTLQLESGREQTGQALPSNLPIIEQQPISKNTWRRYNLELPVEIPLGYHQLKVEAEGVETVRMQLILVPSRCYQPEALADSGCLWGPEVQLYALRSEHNWGIGDFTDLKHLIGLAAENGAGIVGISPLHALFPQRPAHASPYSPSSRQFLNTLFIDVEAIAEFHESGKAQRLVRSDAFQARLRSLRTTELVNYADVADAKTEVFEILFQHFSDHHLKPGTERAKAFRAFQQEKGDALFRHTLFEALQEHFSRNNPDIQGWQNWPASYRNPASKTVAAFAASHVQRLEFYQYLQWQAQLQLQAVGHRSWELGLGVGLYQDLAVSIDPGGADAWANQALYAFDANIGSPPDEYNLKGQDWGLPPPIPERFREAGYAPFIATLRANMRVTGALRIDHVMSLMRLYWVPKGNAIANGSYIRYPLQDLLGIVALESQRNRCLIIGEDLGTVPTEIPEAMKRLGILSCRLFFLEKDSGGEFRPPEAYPKDSLVALTTHDLPTLAGLWQGKDLQLRKALHLFPTERHHEQQLIKRAEDRARLLLALEHQQLLPEELSSDPVKVPEMTQELACAIHRYLARAASQVMTIQMEDIFLQTEQVNLPGTNEQYPNWQRKLPLNLEYWADDPGLRRCFDAMREERGSAVHPPVAASGTAELRQAAVIPRATYRLQFHHDFTFAHATEIVPYLAALGISHCYASPLLMARPGSSHGYDIVEHHRLNPELGSREDFDTFIDTLHQHGLGLILDMVPNHMGVMGHDNPWWLAMLENGPAAASARFFDIDWAPLKGALLRKVLLPVLGDHYGNVLEKGELTLDFDPTNGHFYIRYYEHHFPIDPGSYSILLEHHLGQLMERLGEHHPGLIEFASLNTAFGNLPSRNETDTDKLAERQRDAGVHKQRLARLCREHADIACYIDEVLKAFNDTAGQAADATLLHRLLEDQAYRLAYWRVASDEINYRRFFDINDLASLRMEDSEVFEATHRLILDLIAQRKVQGLRIDHPDGLFNPRQYFQRLQQSVIAGQRSEGIIDDKPLYVVVEKILATHERLPTDWPVHGTTGYDFAALCNDLFVDMTAEKALTRTWNAFTNGRENMEEARYQCKILIMRAALASELNVLATQLSRIAETDTHTRDYTLNSLRRALVEVTACFPVYRTYVSEDGASDKDTDYVKWAVGVAKKRSLAADTSVFDFLQEVLLTTIKEGKAQSYREQVTAFAMKFQQYSAPVMAKGMEDTAFYRYNRLVSLNEVGGEPDRFGISPAVFHWANQQRLQLWPHAMLAGSTHDNKRSEDVRARINVLSEWPDEWRTRLNRWARINRAKKCTIDDVPAPSRNDEYLLYQTLVGSWPTSLQTQDELDAYRERINAYMNKALKEAKQHTSWINPNSAYEEAMSHFITALLGKLENNTFLSDFLPFAQQCARFGYYNSLAQTQLRLTVPGVPDIYQGTELFAFNLVDPDNRRPVDFVRHRNMLEAIVQQSQNNDAMAEWLRGLVETPGDDRAKLFLIWKLLEFRRDHEALFRDGDYQPLTCEGERAEQLCAFVRTHNEQQLISFTPRLFVQLTGDLPGPPLGKEVWGDTLIQAPAVKGNQSYHNLLSNESIKTIKHNGERYFCASEIFTTFPVAVLVNVKD